MGAVSHIFMGKADDTRSQSGMFITSNYFKVLIATRFIGLLAIHNQKNIPGAEQRHSKWNGKHLAIFWGLHKDRD